MTIYREGCVYPGKYITKKFTEKFDPNLTAVALTGRLTSPYVLWASIYKVFIVGNLRTSIAHFFFFLNRQK